MKNTRLFASIASFSLVASLAFPGMASAQLELDAGFNPSAILSDADIFDANAFPYDRMVRFLQSKGPLAELAQTDIDGQVKPIPQIIWRVSQSYKLNPKYLIALIQKEQSLVEDPTPSQGQLDWAAGYGVCDSCAKDDPDIQDFKGFAAQLEWAAKQHREKYLLQLLTRGLTIGGQGVGKTVSIDGLAITPSNNATAMLYSYTPHIHGNMNLWRIWKRWFSVKFPDNTIVRAMPSKKVYLLRFGEKRPFASNSVVSTMIDPKKIVDVQETDLSNYPDGAAIKFPDYALLRDPEGRIFLLVGSTKRQITNMEAFRKFGFNIDEVEEVESADLAAYTDGLKITTDTQFPQGVLMKLADAPGVWYVEDGKRHPLIDGVLLKLYFRGRQIKTVSLATLEAIPEAEPYQLHDGELTKIADEPTVYVVEHGLLRPIPDETVFNAVGWSWKNIVTVPRKLLSLHQLGSPVHEQGEHAELAASTDL
jgi:hypothetical protein